MRTTMRSRLSRAGRGPLGATVVAFGLAAGIAGVAFAGEPGRFAPPAFDTSAASAGSASAASSVQTVERAVRIDATGGLKGRVDAKGTDLWRISALGSFDVPEAALRAYHAAAATMARTRPSCEMPWTLLAGIGRVESDHGRYGGSVLGSDGVPRPAIRGVPLNGSGPVAAVPDTDDGRFDGDKVWDRAVGPMQFIPSTWRSAGRDGDGDGTADPNDIDDAALAAADYLCPASGSILPPDAMRSAILGYNHSDYYVALVMAFEKGYRTGTFSIPSPPPPPTPVTPAVHASGSGGSGQHATAQPAPHTGSGTAGPATTQPTATHTGSQTGGGGGGSTGGSGSKGSKGSGGSGGSGGTGSGGSGGSGGSSGGSGGSGGSTSSPAPSPTPTETPYAVVTGVLAASGGGWTLGGQALDLGSAATLASTAKADFDGDGTKESNHDELTGLEGHSVSMTVQSGTSPLLVTAVQGYSY